MPIRHYLISMLLLALAGLTTACADRNEDFCTMVCECINPGDVAGCTSDCVVDVDELDAQQDQPVVTDECFACVNRTSCQEVEATCDSVCTILNSDDGPQPGNQN